MPNTKTYPLFYVIKSQRFGKEFMKKVIKNIIKTWFFFAKKGILLEYHTQNILVDKKVRIYYRDLSDIRVWKNRFLKPEFKIKDESELRSLVFDRTVCLQNLDHFFKYDTKLGEKGRKEIKEFLKRELENSGLKFPNYTVNFSQKETEIIPKKYELVFWRDFS